MGNVFANEKESSWIHDGHGHIPDGVTVIYVGPENVEYTPGNGNKWEADESNDYNFEDGTTYTYEWEGNTYTGTIIHHGGGNQTGEGHDNYWFGVPTLVPGE